jgi:hypothetical protein
MLNGQFRLDLWSCVAESSSTSTTTQLAVVARAPWAGLVLQP